ncbi:PREDICTED: probable cytochrome P450 304a1 isoform X1 [Vollenhovia emeryi]|uniref:probable cytochrome P450 304a1 isoform X1 n=1 Tax=Vollenhovia emeryi TaxID=411798 RepID=UPI0005F4B553|nr:PREDICTED: probable cytochrome P450 304a1 isoform X1 [Vollenhovia emeryi]
MSPLLVVICTLLLVYKLYRFLYDKPPNTPPGIIRLPIGGCYLLLLWGNYKFPHLTIDYYVKKLKSKIISCYMGNYFAIIVNDYESIKEVLSRSEFDGRLTNVHHIKDRAFGKELGIFFTDGDKWSELRRFALRHMRDFGFGRRQEKLESEIMDETSILLDILKNGPVYDGEKEILKGNLALFPDILYASSGNNIWNILFGYRLDRTEHDILLRFGRAVTLFQSANDTTGGAIFQYEFLKYFGNMFGYKNHMKGSNILKEIIQKHLEFHKITFDKNNDRGFIDNYLKKMNEDEANSFTDEELIILLIDILMPAFSALPGTITHTIKYLMHHPRVMEKVQNDIDNVVGTGRLATWEDRKHLPYLEAIIREVMRIETLLPLSIIHRATENTTLKGYDIPAGTPVVTNLAALHYDPDLWGDPEIFRPERFLKENGQLVKDFSLPFSFGRRLCIGETYSRYNLFGTLAVLLQNFNFFFVEGEPSSLNDKESGIIVMPKELWIRFELR